MANVYVIKFEPWHYRSIVESGDMVTTLNSVASDNELEWLANNAYSYTYVYANDETGVDEFVGVCFVSEWVKGNGQVNMIVTNKLNVFGVRKAFWKVFTKQRDQMFEIGLHRLQCEVNVDFEEGRRLVRHMGFESEGISKGMYDKYVDVERFAIVRR